ncbi:hypothetical protein BaRGS_00029481 [Batillaria attramentaria]|uniref:Autophagy-related protein 9 n=1 Tax=Batillaria attramentaria TaxID=370345 RepID=A0ABD0JXI1_9CAEN
MADYETQYQALGSYDEEEEETDDNDIAVTEEVMIHVCPESSKSRWNHIEDLDDFFTRIYHYHQRGGFACMALEDTLQLVQVVFVVLFAAFLGNCVSYDVLFANIDYNTTHKVTLDEAFYPLDECAAHLTPMTVVLLLLALATWIFRLIKVLYNIFKYYEIRSFYTQALKIYSSDLPNLTWHEVQAQLIEVQKEQQMCIHKKDLTQLDIYHRILRFKNYMVSMANVSALPLKHSLPFLGEYAFLSTGLKYNLEFILFWGPGAPFENNWHLRNEYKNARNREMLAQQLSSRILWIGLANLVFSPVVFVWQIIYSFFRYAELIKRQPSIFGSRKWSNYSRLYLRHFNELDHEFNARLNKGYQPVSDYLNIFTTPLVVIFAKNVMFFAGAILAVLVCLTIVDEDVLNVEHVLTIITVCGLIMTVCKGLIPDEHIVYSPELLLRNVAMAIHYMPNNWAGHAHTARIRDEFSMLFQFKIVYIIEELLSPLVTPFILIFSLRPRSLALIDFFRRFTVDVIGVGDVCSFAQMDVKKHGNAQWQVGGAPTAPPKSQQAENGKTEMSLMHFHLTNPEWKPNEDCTTFISTLKEQVQRDIVSRSLMTADSHHMPSLVSLPLGMPSLVPPQAVGPFTSMLSSFTGGHTITPSSVTPSAPTPASGPATSLRLRGAVSHMEGPLMRPAASSMFSSLQSSTDSGGGLAGQSVHVSLSHQALRQVDECTRELMTNEMNLSALYMHELRWRRAHGEYMSFDDHARAVWQQQPSASPLASPPDCDFTVATGPPTSIKPMPEITEEGSADDEREVDTSLMVSCTDTPFSPRS